MSLRPQDIRKGETYAAAAGGWTYQVESVGVEVVFYIVCETEQRCATTLHEFARRVSRRYIHEPSATGKKP